jgi:hypothetical protein
MRSKIQVGFGPSGAMVTQLSTALAAPMVEPPQIRTWTGSVYGANWGNNIAEPRQKDLSADESQKRKSVDMPSRG